MRSVLRVTRFASMVAALGLLAQPLFAFALQPNDAEYDALWYLDAIRAEDAWDISTGSRTITVAVLDTGVDIDHPDLVRNIWVNDDELGGNGIDDDANGYVDDVQGWDFIDNDNSPAPDPDGTSEAAVSHGTVIAGIIGASGNNGIGVSGLLWDVQIMPVRMLDAAGSGSTRSAAAAIDYAVRNGADVINLSFAGENSDATFRASVARAYAAGVVVVAAMGNASLDTDAQAVYPACLRDGDSDWVIGVASSTTTDEASVFSNYGSACTDISAPGEEMFGTMYYDRATGYSTAYAGGWTGTSLASPVVAGSVALLLAAYPLLTVDEVIHALKLSVDPLTLARSMRGKFGAGRLNVGRAMQVAGEYAALRGVPTTPVATEDGEQAQGDTGVSTVRDVMVVSAATSGSEPYVTVHTADGSAQANFLAYGAGFRGGVRVAAGDVDGDGDGDVVTGAGAGGGPHVRVFTAQGALLGEFFPFDAASRKGVDVAVGDVDGDGVDDIVSVVGAGVSSEVVVTDAEGVVKHRFVASVFGAAEALRVAVGDVDGDGAGEIVLAGGAGSAPRVVIYRATGAYLLEFAPYAAGFVGGVFVTTGDVNGDGKDEIVTGTGRGGGPHVRIFTQIGAAIGSFFAYDATTRNGARVAMADVDGDGVREIITAPGPTMTDVRIYDADGTARATWATTRTGGEGTAVAAW